MPTPIIPKRRRSLGATACAAPRAGSESRKIEPAIKEAPAAPADVCKNARRDKRALFIVSILLWGDSTPCISSYKQWAEPVFGRRSNARQRVVPERRLSKIVARLPAFLSPRILLQDLRRQPPPGLAAANTAQRD